MGTKGASGIKEKILGSNAGDVITKVQCNTLIVPVQVKLSKPREIAFPTDFNIFIPYVFYTQWKKWWNWENPSLGL